MKINLLILCLLVLGAAILTACGRNNTPDIELPNNAMSIRWGYGYGWSGVDELLPDVEIVDRISSRFVVSVIPELIQGGYDENNPPNIFVTSSNPHDLLQYGTTRTIPMDMISRYAPNYYNLLMSIPFGLDVYKDHTAGGLIGLPIYSGSAGGLEVYSVYRLDWLERYNIALPNNIVPIREGQIYFTDTPFTHDQFIQTMRAFSEPSGEFGFAIMRRHGQLQYLRALKGMWGLGNGIVNDNGRPNYYFADPRYKEFLLFMARMYEERLFAESNLNVTTWVYTPLRLGMWPAIQTGWFQLDLVSLLAAEGNVPFLLEDHPDARLLVTPPEIGPFGDSGVSVQSALPFLLSMTWVTGSQTSDEELAVILEIFDYVTFDRYAYAMVNFGFEGEHYEWEGIPFESRAIGLTDPMTAYNSGVYVFGTFMFSHAGNLMRNGDNALIRYSISNAARRAVILPYREDIHGDFALQYAELTERYGEELMRIRERFFLLAMRGQIDIETEWYTYIDELHQNGLSQFLALIEQFPVVGR